MHPPMALSWTIVRVHQIGYWGCEGMDLVTCCQSIFKPYIHYYDKSVSDFITMEV